LWNATLLTFPVWWVKVLAGSWGLVTSQSFTVQSALPLAMTWRWTLFQLSPMTASVWLPGKSFSSPPDQAALGSCFFLSALFWFFSFLLRFLCSL
jgi:hypothetical protein